MTIEELASLGEIVGAIGVIGSLIYVGAQVRQNTKATWAQTQENMTRGYVSLGQMTATHAEVFSRGMTSTDESFASLSDDEKVTYFNVIFGYFKHFENMHSQYENNLIDDESWDAWSRHIVMFFHQPGVQMWWPQRRDT